MMWWLVITTRAGVYAWPVWEDGEHPDERLINAARVLTGFPADDSSWVVDRGYDLQLTPGTPHHTLLARATVGTVDDLRAVHDAKVDEHVAARVDAHQAVLVASAKDALAALPPELLALVVTHPDLVEQVATAVHKGG